MSFIFCGCNVNEAAEMLPRMLGKHFRLQHVLADIYADRVAIYIQERFRKRYKFIISTEDIYACKNSTVLAIMKAVEFKTGEIHEYE